MLVKKPLHMVNRLVMAVDLDTQERAAGLQERFSAFCEARLPALLDTVLSRFSIPLQSRVLSHVEIDLGSVPERVMEEVLAEKIDQALHERLIRLLGLPLAAEHDAPNHEYILRALAEGLFQRVEIDRLMQAALATQPNEVATLLRQIGRDPLVRWHLATALRDVTLTQVVQVLRPRDAAVIIEYAQHIQIQQQHTQAVPIPETDFKHALWEVIFAYLLADRGSQFNRYTFIDNILWRIAERYSLNYLQLLDGLLRQVAPTVVQVGRNESLITILFRLRKKAHPVDPSQTESSANIQNAAQHIYHGSVKSEEGEQSADGSADAALTIESQQRWLSALAMFLEHGVLPWFAPHTENAIQVLFNSLIETSPYLLAAWLKTALIHTAARNRLARQLPSEMRNKILRLIIPDQADAILQWLTPLVPILRRCIERNQLSLTRSSTFSEAWLIEEWWIALFEFAAKTQPSRPASYAWLRRLLQRTAVQNRWEYTSLLASLVLEVKASSSLTAAARDLHTALLSLYAEALVERAHGSEVRRRLAFFSGATAIRPLCGLSLFSRSKRFNRAIKKASHVDEPINPAYRCLRWLSQGIWPLANLSQESSSRHRRARGKEKGDVQYASAHLYRWLYSLPDNIWRWALQRLKTNECQAALQRIMLTPVALRLRVFRLLVAQHEGRAVVELMQTLSRAMVVLGLKASPLQQAQARLFNIMLSAPPGTPLVHTIQNLMQLLAVHYAIPLRRWFEVLFRQAQTDKKGSEATFYHLLEQVRARLKSAFAISQKFAVRKDTLDFPEESSYSADAIQLASVLEHMGSDGGVLAEKSQLDKQVVSVKPLNALEGLCYFLDYGVLPEGEKWRSFSSTQWFEHAFIQDKQAALDALRARADRPDILGRLWACMPSSMLRQLIVWLIPQYAPSIISFLLAGEALQSDTTLSGAQQARTAQLHWQLTLAMLLNPHAPTFSLQAFLDQISTQAAQRLGLSVDIYTQRLLIATQQRNQHAGDNRKLLAILTAKLSESATESVQTNVDQPDKTLTPASFSLEILDAFLRFGQVPADGVEALTEAVKHLHSTSSALLRRRIRIAIGNALERTRLAWLLPWHSFMVWLRWLWPTRHDSIHAIIEGLAQIAAQADGRIAFWRSMLIEILLTTVSHRSKQRWQWHDLLEIPIQRLIQQQSLNPASVIATLRAKFLHISAPTILFAALDWVELSLLDTRLKTSQKKQALNESLRLRAPAARPQAVQASNTENQVSLPAEEAFYIHNAGLVLLWPFLSRYFQILELVEAKEFCSPDAQSRAIYLLQYLVTGSFDVSEPALLLNKLLCGAVEVPTLDLALARHLPLSEREIAISEDILYGVTQNWEKLRNTSIAGLRESFLLRDGKLEKRKDEAWTLTVSLKAYDVLLDSLPWSLSTIRLPWMKNVLYVRWR